MSNQTNLRSILNLRGDAMKSQGIATFLDTLKTGPDELRHALTELATSKRSELGLQRDKKRLMTREAAAIAATKDENGKPKYSNEVAREAAMNERVKEWGEMRVIDDLLDKYAREISDASIEVEYWQARISAARAAAVLLASGVEG